MGLPTGMYLKGIDKLERHANQVAKEVEGEKLDIIFTEAKRVRDRIKQKAPTGPTGNLKKGAYASKLAASLSQSAVAFAGIRPRKAPHAHLVEYGHAGPHPAPPHPFFRPAIDEIMPSVKENIEKKLGKTIEGAF
jgi:HK97 gp10 family phage protein